jgi:hypothetical protein
MASATAVGTPSAARGARVPQRSFDPGQPSSDEKNAALGAYLGAFFMPVLLPLLIMLTARTSRSSARGLQRSSRSSAAW